MHVSNTRRQQVAVGVMITSRRTTSFIYTCMSRLLDNNRWQHEPLSPTVGRKGKIWSQPCWDQSRAYATGFVSSEQRKGVV
ncbi:hypothetical protein AC578_5289 [Pseudocercospora eumusae]|uniref:Uncharacterized protein n=1 Tax=Pseudocercospora eumusae TaxID=321146 RepID=A0A139GW80_9PEZI|nr:hypothetical protein AC578_5289 [Pseudocercospora eumusae]